MGWPIGTTPNQPPETQELTPLSSSYPPTFHPNPTEWNGHQVTTPGNDPIPGEIISIADEATALSAAGSLASKIYALLLDGSLKRRAAEFEECDPNTLAEAVKEALTRLGPDYALYGVLGIVSTEWPTERLESLAIESCGEWVVMEDKEDLTKEFFERRGEALSCEWVQAMLKQAINANLPNSILALVHKETLNRLIEEDPGLAKRAVNLLHEHQLLDDESFSESWNACALTFIRSENQQGLRKLLECAPKTYYVNATLVIAISNNSLFGVELALEFGATAAVRAWDLLCPRSFAYVKGASCEIQSALELLEQPGKEEAEELGRRKALAHAWELGGRTEINGVGTDLEGWVPHLFVNDLLHAIATVKQHEESQGRQTAPLLDEISRLVSQLSQQNGAIEAGTPLLLELAGEKHVIFILINEGVYYVCNKGGHQEEPVEAFHLPEGRFNRAVYEALLCTAREGAYSSTALKEAISDRTSFQPMNTEAELLSRSWLDGKLQTAENCSLEGILAGIYTYLISEVVKKGDHPPHSSQERIAIEKAYALYTDIRKTLMVELLEHYLQEPQGAIEKDWQLIEKVKKKAASYTKEWWGEHANRALARCGVT